MTMREEKREMRKQEKARKRSLALRWATSGIMMPHAELRRKMRAEREACRATN